MRWTLVGGAFTAADGQTVHAIGDCVVPRRIAHALAAAEAVAANLP
ncbi:hypothetical protein ACFZCU_37430 [Streptomyces canus]|jgi:hypothetical protein